MIPIYRWVIPAKRETLAIRTRAFRDPMVYPERQAKKDFLACLDVQANPASLMSLSKTRKDQMMGHQDCPVFPAKRVKEEWLECRDYRDCPDNKDSLEF
jgi:hypothetical protein